MLEWDCDFNESIHRSLGIEDRLKKKEGEHFVK